MLCCLSELFVAHISFILALSQLECLALVLLFSLKSLNCWSTQCLSDSYWDLFVILWSESVNICLMQILSHVTLLMQCINCELTSICDSLFVLRFFMWLDLCYSQIQISWFCSLIIQMSSAVLIWRTERKLKKVKIFVKFLSLCEFSHSQSLRRLFLCDIHSKSSLLHK